MNLNSQIESILFVASKPLSAGVIAKALKTKEAEVKEALEDLKSKYNHEGSGIHILSEGNKYQMATNPNNAEVIAEFVRQEAAGELTRAQLETLTVIAYRSPITRPELEQIRGVNCAIVLRNLMIRGLIEESSEEDKILPVYNISFEALRHLGLRNVSELSDYEELHAHEYVENTLNRDIKDE